MRGSSFQQKVYCSRCAKFVAHGGRRSFDGCRHQTAMLSRRIASVTVKVAPVFPSRDTPRCRCHRSILRKPITVPWQDG
jgi:hypothetical protein